MLTGTVSEFSHDRGLGTITDVSGRDYLFHVVEIADGSRTIDTGQAVTFRLHPRFGTLEAGAVGKV